MATDSEGCPRRSETDPDCLRIGFLAFPWEIPAPAYGGVERAVDGLCRGLVERGHDVLLWSATSSTCPVPRAGVLPAPVDSTGWHSVPYELHHVIAGYERFAVEGVDIVHDITYAGPFVGQQMIDVPVVTTNYLPFDPPGPGQSSPDLSLLYRAMARSTPVLAISQEQGRGAAGFTPHVITLGLDLPGIPVGDGAGDGDGPYAVFFGRMAPEKGVREAVLASREAGMRLKIASRVSEDHERVYFRDAVEPLVDGEQTVFLGEVARDASFGLLGRASVMVNPITWPEPFGTAMIESLATGTPVVARRGGVVEEVVTPGRTGAICDSFDEIVQAMRDHKSFDRAACRATAERAFSNERVVDDHIDFYRSVLAARR